MEITKDDVPYQLHQLLDIIGKDKFLEVCKLYGGSTVYIPVYKNIIMGQRNKALINDYNGKNIDDLRIKYGITTVYIKKILHEEGIL